MTRAEAVRPIEFLLNGRTVLVPSPAPGLSLLDYIRSIGLTGAKEGCAEGECGACAVALVGAATESTSAYKVVNSCLLPLPLADGHEIYTVESLADGGVLAPAQQVMAAAGGSQCGYCTPGFVMSLFAEQYRPGRQGACDPLSMAGNLCRCTGYRPIRDAALSLGPAPPGPRRDRLDRPAPRLGGVETPAFSRPTTVDACVTLLARTPDTTLIAGSTDLGVEANLKAARWPHLVSLEAIDELREYRETQDSVWLGAGLPLADIARCWRAAPPVIHEWLELFASPLIRNRATLGGNLATASPIGDSAPLLLALDAVVHTAGPDGRRVIPLSSFFIGYRRTALAPSALIVAIEIPKPLPALVRFYKIAKRRLDDISTVAAAMAIDEESGTVRRARFAFGGVAATPIRVHEAETAAMHLPWNDAAVERVQGVLERVLTPIGDHRGSSRYRLEVSKSLVAKFLWDGRQ
ncbi:MAG: FAD binding domain-containing protein [Vicinamibacterales bacterium]